MPIVELMRAGYLASANGFCRVPVRSRLLGGLGKSLVERQLSTRVYLAPFLDILEIAIYGTNLLVRDLLSTCQQQTSSIAEIMPYLWEDLRLPIRVWEKIWT